MQYLEEMLAKIEAENKRLQTENEELRRKTNSLAAENNQLKEKISDDEIKIEVKTEQESPESAVLFTPPQQEQIRAPSSNNLISYLTMMMATSLMCSLACWKNLPAAQRPPPLRTVRRLHSARCLPRQISSLRTRPWWGPQQQSWNPSMN
jgi:X box-binding protein 1